VGDTGFEPVASAV